MLESPTHYSGPSLLAPPYADLYAYPGFRIETDHQQGRICVAGVVGNRGNQAPGRDVHVALGITVRIGGILHNYEKIYTMGKGLRPGDFAFTEPCSHAPLAYYNEDNGAKYKFELLVDLEREVVDLSRSNNFQFYTWWAVRPDALRDGTPLTFAHSEGESAPNVG